ncbi:MAG TPA: alpha/beta hydrolase [Acidimicrobiales bacterium]|nr:alpha/beta hydrolase [Acidimicrobiales bacterium]
MSYLDRNGVSIYYEVHGPAREPGRTPLLLSHGYADTTRMWESNLPALSEHRKVITWDMRGHGRSAAPADQSLYTEDASVEDMKALLDENGVDRAVLGGLSLGGYLSLAFRLRYPERVTGLLLFSTGPGYKRDEPRAGWNASAIKSAERFEQRGLEGFGANDDRASQHTSAAGLARAGRGILTQQDSRIIDALPEITVPTLIIVGADDKAYLQAADVMEAKIPGATKLVVPKAGHKVNSDQTQIFDEAVLKFLDKGD